MCQCTGEAAAVVQWEPLRVSRGRPVHGAAGKSAGVSVDIFFQRSFPF